MKKHIAVLIVSVLFLSLAATSWAETSSTPVTAINNFTINVSDPARSLNWYQGLFGLPIVARQGNTVVMRIGDGPQFMAINGTASQKPGYSHYGLSVDNFNADSFLGSLRELGFTKSDTPGPMQVSVRSRGSDLGGASEGTAEVFIGDSDGLVVQVQDSSYCGGAGALGNVCNKKPAPSKGLLRTREINHVTIMVSDGQRSVGFYHKVFTMPIGTYQGVTPVLSVGSGNAGVVLFDGTALKVPAGIDHACLIVDDFDIDRLVKVLTDYGLEPLGETFRATGPLQVYVTKRLPDRGGDPNGTFELYFTDPDGIVVQLQDARYCGGSGYLGDKCGTPEHPIGRTQ
jgi:catechol 2,3-dioxygenase-like lactoylglutathione lyase family enzyme